LGICFGVCRTPRHLLGLLDGIPPIEAGKTAESTVPANQAATRFRGGGSKEGVIDVVATKPEVATPPPPLGAYPLVPRGLTKLATLLNDAEKLNSLFKMRWSGKDTGMSHDP